MLIHQQNYLQFIAKWTELLYQVSARKICSLDWHLKIMLDPASATFLKKKVITLKLRSTMFHLSKKGWNDMCGIFSYLDAILPNLLNSLTEDNIHSSAEIIHVNLFLKVHYLYMVNKVSLKFISCSYLLLISHSEEYCFIKNALKYSQQFFFACYKSTKHMIDARLWTNYFPHCLHYWCSHGRLFCLVSYWKDKYWKSSNKPRLEWFIVLYEVPPEAFWEQRFDPVQGKTVSIITR